MPTRKDPNKEMLGQLITAQVQIADSLGGIKDNLKALNDANVLHQQNTALSQQSQAQEHNKILDTLKLMTDKYWWLILALIGALLVVTGYPQIAKVFAPIP